MIPIDREKVEAAIEECEETAEKLKSDEARRYFKGQRRALLNVLDGEFNVEQARG